MLSKVSPAASPEVLRQLAGEAPAQWASSSCLGLPQSRAICTKQSYHIHASEREDQSKCTCRLLFQGHQIPSPLGRAGGSQVWRSACSNPLFYRTCPEMLCVSQCPGGQPPQHTPGVVKAGVACHRVRRDGSRDTCPPQTSCGPSFVDHLCNLPLYTWVISPQNLGTQIFILVAPQGLSSGHLSFEGSETQF